MSLSTAIMGLTAIGGLFSAVSSVSQGIYQGAAMKQQAEAASYNRMVALQNAESVRKAGEYAEEQQRKDALRLLGAQKAAYGKAGVTMEGTPLEMVAQTAAELEQEALATRYNYGVEESRYLSQAGYYGYEAERQRALSSYPVGAGILKAGTTLLTTGGSMGMQYQYGKSGGKVPGLVWNPW
jgi:hypothetical protein